MAGDSQWMLPTEIYDYLCKIFPSGGNILEFGSGDGTAILAQSFDICSIEHDEVWARKLVTTCHLIPIKPNELSEANNQLGWYDAEQVRKIIPSNLDVIIVDGPNGTIGRHGILSVLDSLPKNAVYIIDDVHREAELDLLNKFIEWHGGNHEIHTSNYESGKIRRWASISPNGGD